jgi:uroporphyrinogen-III synthase
VTAVLVTRPEPEARRLAARLRGAGYAAIVSPMLRVVLLEDAAVPARPYAAVLVASGNALRALDRSPALPRLRAVPLLAVGERTAARARALGFAEVVAAEGDAAALVTAAETRLAPGAGPLLHLAGAERTGTVEGGLRARGFEVNVVELYRAEPAGALGTEARAALARGEIAAALFSSRRIAETFATLARGQGVADRLVGVAAICASARVAEGLAGLNFAAVVVPDRPTEAAMLAALARVRPAAAMV